MTHLPAVPSAAKAVRCLLLGYALAFLLLMPGSASAAQRILEVEAVVTAEDALPRIAQERMEQSISAIAGQLLIGSPVDMSDSQRTEKQNIIHTVFDKVLIGYSVNSVRILPGETASVTVTLLPWEDRVQNVAVELQVEGMSPEIEALVRQDLNGIDQVFQDGLHGLPIAATDWTNGALKRSLNAFMEAHLPEFRADFDVEMEDAAQVRVTVYPRVPLVRSIDLNMRSDTIPNVFLVNHRDLMRERANLLVGVPVAFVRRHQQQLAAMLEKTLDSQPDARSMHLATKATLEIGEQVRITLRSDSDRFHIRLTGWADIGRKSRSGSGSKNDILLRLHAGRKISKLDEVFFNMDLEPQDIKWSWFLGYARELTPETKLALRYDFRRKQLLGWAQYEFARDWMLRYEYRFEEHTGEVGLRYRLHDFLSLEYVIDRSDNWLRLIGNF